MRSCGFTGYRYEKLPFSRRDGAAVELLKLKLAEACERALDLGCTRFISGFAQGSDLLFAESVVELRDRYEGVTLSAALPFADPHRDWSLFDQRQYCALLEQCDEVKVLQAAYSAGCYFSRNNYILEQSERLIAVFNPLDRRRGGTAYTVEQAKRLELPIDFIIP